MAVVAEEIKVRASVNVRDMQRQLVNGLNDASKRISATMTGATGEAFKKAAQEASKAQEDVLKTRRKLVISAIEDEKQRELQRINFQFDEERKRIERLLKLRLEMGALTRKQFQDSIAEFDRLLDASRDAAIKKVDAPESLLKRFNKMGALLGGALGLGIGVGLTGGLQAVRKGVDETIGSAVDLQEQLTAVREAARLTTEESARMGREMIELSERLGKPVEGLLQIAEAAARLNVWGVRDIASLTEEVVKLAEVTEFDPSTALKAVVSIAEIFEIPIREAGRLTSVLKELEATTTSTAPEIAASIERIGPAGAQIGLTVDQVAALAVTLQGAGFQTEQSSTTIVNALARFRSEGEKFAKVASLTRKEFDTLVRREPLEALGAYLEGLRALSPALRDVEIRKAFRERDQQVISALADRTEQFTTHLTTASEALKDGAVVNRAYAATLEGARRQWDIFTARLAAGALTAGQTVLPLMESLLRAINGVGRSSKEMTDEIVRLDGELKSLDGAERLINRYEELVRQQAEGRDVTDELRVATDELARRFPHLVTEIDATGRALGIFSEQARIAVAESRALLRGMRESEFAALISDLESKAVQLAAAREVRDRAIANIERGTASNLAAIQAGLRGAQSDILKFNEALTDLAPRLDQFVDLSREAAVVQQDLANRGFALTIELIEDLQDRLGKLRSAGPVREIFDFSGLDLEGVRRRIDEIRKALEGLGEGAEATKLKTELEALLRREADILSEIRAEAERLAAEMEKLREQGLRAGEQLLGKERQLRVDAINDEHERRIASIELQFDKERESILKLLELRRRAGQITGEEFTAQLEAFSTALAGLQARATDEANERRLKAEEQLQTRIAQIQRDISIAELDERQIRELKAFTEGQAKQEAAIRQAFERRVAIAESAFEAERARIEREVEDRVEAESLMLRARLTRENEIAKAAEDRAAAEHKLSQDLVRETERNLRERARLYEDYALQVVGLLRSIGREERQFTDNDIALTKFRFDERAKALQEALNEERISRREFDLEMRALAEDRADFDRRVEKDRASFIEKSVRGLASIAIEEATRAFIHFAATKAAESLVHTATEAEKTAATVTGSGIRIGALLAEGATALASAGKAMVEAVANLIKQVIKTVPFPANLAVIPGAALALYGLYKGARKLFGFAEGGHVDTSRSRPAQGFASGGEVSARYTGQGGRYEPAGVVHKGEFVFSKPVVESQLKEFWLLFELLKKGVKLKDLFHAFELPGYMAGGSVNVSIPPMTFSPPAVSVNVPAAQFRPYEMLPGFATGGFADAAAAFKPASPVGTEGFGAAQQDLGPLLDELKANREATEHLGDRISGMEVRLEVGRRTQTGIVKGGQQYRAEKEVRNRLRS